MDNFQNIKKEILVLFQQLPTKDQEELVANIHKIMDETIHPKNLKNLMNERGISQGMYGNVEGFLNNEENATKRKASEFKNKSITEVIKAMRAKRTKKQ